MKKLSTKIGIIFIHFVIYWLYFMNSSISESGMLKRHKKSCSSGFLQCCGSAASPEDFHLMNDLKMRRSKLSIKQITQRRLHSNKMMDKKFVPLEREYTQNSPIKASTPKIFFSYQNRHPGQKKHFQNFNFDPITHNYQDNYQKNATQTKQKTQINQMNNSSSFATKTNLLGFTYQQQKKQKIQKIQSIQIKRQQSKTKISTDNVQIVEQKQEDKQSYQNLNLIKFQMSLLLQSSKGSQHSGIVQKRSQNSNHCMINTAKKEELFGTSNSNAELIKQISITKSLQIPSVNTKLTRKPYQKGKMFSWVRRIDTMFSGDHEQNSQHYSQVVEDYQLLLSKIKQNRLEDSQIQSFKQI